MALKKISYIHRWIGMRINGIMAKPFLRNSAKVRSRKVRSRTFADIRGLKLPRKYAKVRDTLADLLLSA